MTILSYNTIGDYMKTIKECYSSLQTIQKSEFIANIYPVSSIEEINDILTKVRKKYYDATHNCYAYVLGVNADIVKASDDGEPSQTAGVVIYDVLKKNELTNVLAIVTRYFGGIKLGAGGLVRAYSSTTAQALLNAKFFSLTPCLEIELTFAYSYVNLITKTLVDYKLIKKEFDSLVTLIYQIPKSNFVKIKNDLISLTKNEIKIEIIKEITISL